MRLSHTIINNDNINYYSYDMAKSVFHNVIGQFAVRNLLYIPKSQKQMLISQL